MATFKTEGSATFNKSEMNNAPVSTMKYNGTLEAFNLYQRQLAAATPNEQSLNLIGAYTEFLSGPSQYIKAFNDSNLSSNLSMCAQNMNPTPPTNIASSLLPDHGSVNFNDQMEGFGDCDVTNMLGNQRFLAPGGQIGTDTVAGSLRNANQGLRSEPPNPMLNVGPFLNPTIFPDLTRRPLEDNAPNFGIYGIGKHAAPAPTAIGIMAPNTMGPGPSSK